jgi:DNA-binding protein HU-beta
LGYCFIRGIYGIFGVGKTVDLWEDSTEGGGITVNKKEMVDKLAAEASVSKKEAGKLLDSFIKVVEDELATGGSVRLVGFGSFVVKQNSARKGVDPRTKAPINIPAKKVPKFVPGKELKERVR